MTAYSVILTQRDKRNPIALAKALASIRKTPLQDQLHVAKRGWGVVQAHLEQAAAGLLNDQLNKAGIPSAVIADEALMTLPAAEPLKKWEAERMAGVTVIAAAGITQTT